MHKNIEHQSRSKTSISNNQKHFAKVVYNRQHLDSAGNHRITWSRCHHIQRYFFLSILHFRKPPRLFLPFWVPLFIHFIFYSTTYPRGLSRAHLWRNMGAHKAKTWGEILQSLPSCHSTKPYSSMVVTTDLHLHKERTSLL